MAQEPQTLHISYREVLKRIREFLTFLFLAVLPLIVLTRQGLLPTYRQDSALYVLLIHLPYAMFVLVAFLGLRLNQTRIFFTCVLLVTSYICLIQIPFVSYFHVSRRHYGFVLAASVPMSMAILFAFGEGNLFSLKSFLRLLAVFAPLFLFLMGVHANVGFVRSILLFRLFRHSLGFLFPAISVLFLMGWITAIILLRDMSILYFHQAVLLAWIPLFYSYNGVIGRKLGHSSLLVGLAISYSSVCLLFLYAIYKLYWQKAYIDELTSLPNRRWLNELLRTLGRRFAIAMIDIDFFKKFNDTYGHAEGDNVLRFVAKHLNEEFGARAFRYGGEEFCIVFRGANTRDIFAHIARLRKTLAETDFFIRSPDSVRERSSKRSRGKEPKSHKRVRVTISAGLASRTRDLRTPEEVISQADKALYEAKRKGRNCVVSSDGYVLSV